MSASRPGNMRGPWLRIRLPLLLLLLLATLTGKALCQEEEEGEITEEEPEAEEEVEPEIEGDGDPTTPVPDATLAPDPLPTEDASSDPANGEEEKQGSGDEGEKKSRSFGEYGEIPQTSTIYPDNLTISPEEEQGLSLIIILIPVVLVVLIIGMIVCGIFINRRWNQKVRKQELGKEDPYLDGSSTEKVPMPMFEEDVPSVLELEMEELDQWMKKDGETAEDSEHV